MERLVLCIFVLAFIIAIQINGEHIHNYAERIKNDIAIQECLNETKITIEEVIEVKKKWRNLRKNNEEIDKETKEDLAKHSSFLACVLEKKDLMRDSMLVLDKILDILNDRDYISIPSKEVVTKCVNTLNENSEMSREDRAFELIVCVFSKDEDRTKYQQD